MLKSLLARLSSRPGIEIPESSWKAALAALPFVARLSAEERGRLRELAGQLLADKEMSGAAGLELNADMQVNIAVQACLPILNLGIEWYRGWTSIIIYPSQFKVPREIADEDGVVHEYEDTIAGEAWEGGPLLLSWDDAQHAPERGIYNVVIHEFTHKLDMLNGDPDGMPPFDRKLHDSLDPQNWAQTLEDALERFNAELELIAAELPPHLDPDSEEADPYYAHLPLDPYAAQDEGEFFAVSSEAFFVDAQRLYDAFPAWYEQLARFFRQDPLGKLT